MKKTFLITGLILLLMPLKFWGQDTLVSWTFPTGSGADSFATKAISANASCVIHTAGGTSVIDFSKNGFTTKAAQVTGWNNGANTKCWWIEIHTNGYKEIDVYSKQQSGGSNPGPRDFKLQYRISFTGTWTDITGGKIKVANVWDTGVVKKLRLPDTTNNQANLYLRWVMATDTNISGNIVASTGIGKIDDIFVLGQVITTGVQEVKTEINSIWPNPSNGVFTIQSNQKFYRVEIMDLSGKTVFNKRMEAESKELTIDLSGKGSGIYLARIYGDKGIDLRKLVIE